MHANEQLLTKLFRCLNAHDHHGIADCYDDDAVFDDIAFTLKGKGQIHAMWDMICSENEVGVASDITVTVNELSANEVEGRAVVIDDYTFRDTGRKIHNLIESAFEFRGGKIIKQKDKCDSTAWARQAFGGFKGIVVGNFGFIRRYKAMSKLKQAHPQAFAVAGK